MNTLIQKLIFLACLLLFYENAFAQNAFQKNYISNGLATCNIEQQVLLCPNQTFTVDSIPYGAPWVVTDTIFSTTGDCDTVITYFLTALPYNHATKTIRFCPGESVVIDGITFSEPGVYFSNNPAPSTTGGCDTIFTYFFEYLPQPVRSDTISLVPGDSVIIGGIAYTAPGEATDLIPALTGCDTLVTYVLLLDLTFPDTCSKTVTYLKVLGQAGVSERSSVICAASDGNFYIAGEKEKQSLLMKITPDGDVLWSRSFQPVASLTTRITDLIEDSEGMLAGCGIVNPDNLNPEAWVFRFNPVTGNMIWSRYLKQGKPEAFAIAEQFPGGNFLLLVNPQLVANVDDAQIWELNRNNGTLASAVDNYTFGISDVWSSMVVHDSSVYVIGRHIPGAVTVPAPLDKMLTGLSRIDTATNAPVWSRLGHVENTARTTLYGCDLLVHDNAILGVSSGFDSLDSNPRSAFFLQKNTLNGDLLWLKRYTVPGLQNVEAHDIQRASDGYILTGQVHFGGGDWDKIVVKTDFDGNVAWAKSVVSDIYSYVFPFDTGQFFLHNHQSVVVNDVLYLTGFTQDFPSDILLLKMTADGEVSDSCGFVQSLAVQAQDIVNPVNEPIQVASTPFIVSSVNTPVTTLSTEMHTAALCLRCCEPVQIADTVEFCPGESVTIGGIMYNQPGTVVDTVAGIVGCDTIATYTLSLLPLPMRSTTIEFCPGDTVIIGGSAYAQPGTVVDTIPASTGCDTVVTYTLQFIDPPASVLSIECIEDINIATDPGTGPIAVNYDLPVVMSNCECPGISLVLTDGLPSGSIFPVTTTQVCYEARDSCGSTANCCFNVTVREEQPCDQKTIGCMKWELLEITKDAENDLTYSIRVTNNCTGKMIYSAIQIPDGIVAVEPANNSVYTASSGRLYDVRNPNFSPFYSIRFKSQADSIANGQSDIFKYKLPGQTPPAYIHVTARLAPQIFYETYLNTNNCPVQMAQNRNDPTGSKSADFNMPDIHVFPNPTNAALYADLSIWQGEQLQIQVFNNQGQRVLLLTVEAGAVAQPVALPEGLPGGLYFLEAFKQNGEKRTARFVIQR